MKLTKTAVAVVSVGAFFAFAGTAGAATIPCTTSTAANGATLSVTHALDAACFTGNDTNLITSTFDIFGLTGWILADKNGSSTDGDQSITFTSGVTNGTKLGSWEISSLGTAASVMVNLKAGNGWGSFLVGTTSGTWTSTKELSHASVYYRPGTPSPVPLPAAGWMLLAGLGGIAAAKRRKKA
jgi:hypothetical protein